MTRIKKLKKRLARDISTIRRELAEKKREFKKFQKMPTLGEKIAKNKVIKKFKKRSRTISSNINNYFDLSERQTRKVVNL